MLIIRKLHRQFPERVVEWGISYMLISWGAVLLLTPDAFDAVGPSAHGRVYHAWSMMAPQLVWALTAVSIGGARLVALYINGAHRTTPMARAAGAGLSMLVWFFASYGVLKADIITTAIGIYPWLMVGDAYSAYNAGGDWAKAQRHRSPVST